MFEKVGKKKKTMWPLDLREVWVGSERPWGCVEDCYVKEEDLDVRGSWTTGGVARQVAHAFPGQY